MIILMLISTVGIMGPQLSKGVQYPFFVVLRYITIFKHIKRIEPLIIVIWIISDYVFVSMLISSVSEAARSVFRNQKKAVTVLPCALLVAVMAYLVSNNAFEFATVSKKITPAVNMVYTLLALPIIYNRYIAKKAKSKIKKKKGKKGIDKGKDGCYISKAVRDAKLQLRKRKRKRKKKLDKRDSAWYDENPRLRECTL